MSDCNTNDLNIKCVEGPHRMFDTVHCKTKGCVKKVKYQERNGEMVEYEIQTPTTIEVTHGYSVFDNYRCRKCGSTDYRHPLDEVSKE